MENRVVDKDIIALEPLEMSNAAPPASPLLVFYLLFSLRRTSVVHVVE
jgi:hypothetical protein